MEVSVIIPVFNAAKYVGEAVHSALIQPETKEVILVEDGSLDDSLVVCQMLERKYPKVKLFRHENKGNNGPGASRNLGVKQARCSYIAFLDADDYYLENRFEKAKIVFQEHLDADGVYGAFDTIFTSKKYERKYTDELGGDKFVTFQGEIPPNELFYALLNKQGHFYLESLILKQSVFEKLSNFNENFRWGEDTDFMWRLCINCQLYPGELVYPIGIRRIHSENSIFQMDEMLHQRYLLLKAWIEKLLSENWASRINRLLVKKYIVASPVYRSVRGKLFQLIIALLVIVQLCIKYPRLVRKLF